MHKLKIFFISDKKTSSHYFSLAMKNVRNYFNKIDVNFLLIDNDKIFHEKWIIVIINDIPLNKIDQNFVEHFNKSFTLFIYLAKEYTESVVENAYEKEFDYVINMKLTSPKNFSLFLRNVISKRLEIKAKNQKILAGKILADIVSKRIWIKGEEYFLTRKEFDVLILLMKKPNHFFGSDEIFKEVWKTNDYDRTRSVSQYVHRLKNKIGYQYFETNPNLGYKIIAKNK